MDYISGAVDATNIFIAMMEQAADASAQLKIAGVTNPQPPTASVWELGMKVRITNSLIRGGLTTVGDVDKVSTEQLLRRVHDFGQVSFISLNQALKRAGYQPKPPRD